MNESPPLNENEKTVLDKIIANAGGENWVTRAFLEDQLCRPDKKHPHRFGQMPQRTLDRALRHLERVGVIVRQVAQDHGSVYAVSAMANSNPVMRSFALKGRVKGEISIILPGPNNSALKLTIKPPPPEN